MQEKIVLISGGGIAGLTLGILLKEKGWAPRIIEKAPALRTEGYMMDFAGSGWDVAERMGLVDDIMRVSSRIESWSYVGPDGSPRFPPAPLERIRRALDGRYAPIRRPDLERILYDRAVAAGVPVTFGTEIDTVLESDAGVDVRFSDGTAARFGLLFGADGVHSRVRERVFGPESQFSRFLGYYVAAFHLDSTRYAPGQSLKIYEEPCRVLWVYPSEPGMIDAMFSFCHADAGHVPREERPRFVREQCRGMGWIAGQILDDMPEGPIYFDSATQIVMPSWHTGRIALLGDACGCLTLIAGQGSHMAMAGAWVLARELERHDGDPVAAFTAYETFLRPFIERKQDDAVRTADTFVPRSRLQMLYRYPLLRLVFSDLLIKRFFAAFGAKSILAGYR
jgi:2-polyprenyl-6-methoxyphenol hydroxylase-like FAD-dependent oxidoreductase